MQAFLNVLHSYKKEASDFCTGVQIKAKRLSRHEIVGQLCDVRLHENEFYATKITGYFSSSFHPFVFYLPGKRRISSGANLTCAWEMRGWNQTRRCYSLCWPVVAYILKISEVR